VLLQLEYIKKRVDYGERVNKGIFNVWNKTINENVWEKVKWKERRKENIQKNNKKN
jgi:hypothetical protein